MKPIHKRNFFSPHAKLLMLEEINRLKQDEMFQQSFDMFFMRLGASHNEVFDKIHPTLVARVSNLVGTPVRPTYTFSSFYIAGEGICPSHKDRDTCEVTVTFCANQNEPWGFFVDGVEYILEAGDALIYSGTNSEHYRNKIQPNNFCDLVLFHFIR